MESHFSFIESSTLDKSPRKIARMFSTLAPHYDLMNDIMTLFIHRTTRNFALKLSGFSSGQYALDLATGTGDFAFLLQKQGGKSSKVIGCDFSNEMIAIAKQRLRKKEQKFSDKIEFLESNITNLPFNDEEFDVCTISYGIRNVQNPLAVLREIRRVTKIQGRVVIVESSFPRSKFLRFLLTFHFSYIVPLLAQLLSSNATAYSYYFRSVKEFQSGKEFLKILKLAGWKRVWVYHKLMGAVTIYLGKK
jgi:demethylmenaquinone methyltransferase/2-methoxy-6-polyprenyl-1,4-benzoquinol methylase